MPDHVHHYRPVPVRCAACGHMATFDVGALMGRIARMDAALEDIRCLVNVMPDAFRVRRDNRMDFVQLADNYRRTIRDQIDAARGKG